MVCMMIVPDALKPAAEGLARLIDPEISPDVTVFNARLRPVGGTETTHWYCGPNLVDAAVIETIRSCVHDPRFAGAIYHECDPEHVAAEIAQLLERNGLERVPTKTSK